MKRPIRFRLVLATLMSLLALSTLNARAEQMVKLGDWNVHYIAFGSAFLTPQVAQAYGLIRSKYKGVINISVLKNDKAEKVAITGTASNLVGNKFDLNFKEIVEGDAVYYIAQIDYSNEETFRFNIHLRQGNQSQTLQFEQQFYAD